MSLTDPQNPNVKEEREAIKAENWLAAERDALVSMSAFMPLCEYHHGKRKWSAYVLNEDFEIVWNGKSLHERPQDAFAEAMSRWETLLSIKASETYRDEYVHDQTDDELLAELYGQPIPQEELDEIRRELNQ